MVDSFFKLYNSKNLETNCKKIVKVEVDKLGVFQVILAVCIRKTFLGSLFYTKLC